jgi:hypothetical protein
VPVSKVQVLDGEAGKLTGPQPVNSAVIYTDHRGRRRGGEEPLRLHNAHRGNVMLRNGDRIRQRHHVAIDSAPPQSNVGRPAQGDAHVGSRLRCECP